MVEKRVIPELQALLKVVATKEAKRQARLKISPSRLDDRGAAFVWVPEDTQRAIVNLVRETTRLPRDPAIKDLQRQLEEKDAALERLNQEPEELRLLLNNRDNQLSDRGEEIQELRAMNAEQERKLAQCLKEKNVLREGSEAKLSKVRKAERAITQEATAGQSLDERFESFLAAVSMYLNALKAPEVKELEPAKIAEHFKLVRARLLKIDDEVRDQFAAIKKVVKEQEPPSSGASPAKSR